MKTYSAGRRTHGDHRKDSARDRGQQGLGRHLAQELRDRGATVYAAARNPESVDLAGVIPIALDVTDPASVAAAAAARRERVDPGQQRGLIDRRLAADRGRGRRPARARHPLLRHLEVIRAFAPQLAAQQRSAILNILSVLSWVSFPDSGAYCAAKSAEWSLTNALRQELAAQGTRVSALHVGYMDTDMARHVSSAKSNPADIAKIAVDGIAAGDAEIIADELSKQVLARLSSGVAGLYPQLA